MKKIVILLLLLALASCDRDYHTKIEQDVQLDSAINCTYQVFTWVWIYKDELMASWSHIEWSDYKYKVFIDNVDSVKAAQMEKALIAQAKIDSFLAINKFCIEF